VYISKDRKVIVIYCKVWDLSITQMVQNEGWIMSWFQLGQS